MFSFFSFFIFPFFGALKSESYPEKLTQEDEKMYLTLMQQGSKEARSKLIEHNLRLVAHIAKKYELTFEEKDDVLSIGITGLIKAVDNFNFNATNKLATYAAKCIENEILMHIRSNKNKKNTVSLSQPIGSDKDGNEIELMDIVKDNTDSIEDIMLQDELVQRLGTSLKILTDTELDIIKRRYGIFGCKQQTQKEISEILDISRSYVSRIEKRALMKLYLHMIQEEKNKKR
ncbi:MAG: RNA polymerase sporulation sigma factor SigK [bacterium]